MITIKSNDRGRSFLVFDTLFDLDNSPDFQDSMFSAVYITNTSLSETITILGHINPITSRKCCYKPFFVSRKHEGKLGRYSELVDGYIFDINDAETDQKTESILSELKETGIQRIVDDLSSPNLLFIRLLRFFISRKKQQLVPELMEGSNLGYVIPVMSIFYQSGLYNHKDYIIFMQTMVEKGYLKTTKFLNKVYLCPQCLHSHLLYVETCPKCGSSNITSEEVIHHFRCANISPESAYNYGGQLRCPKCHQMLRHIGVDYDRPSTVYYCKSCTNNFLQPQMTAICTNCRKESNVQSLVGNDIVCYEVTPKGRRELISTNVYGSMYTEYYDNYIEYEHFMSRLKLTVQQARFDNDKSDTSVVQVWMLDSRMATRPLKSEFISHICETFKYNNISYANNMLYIKQAGRNDSPHDIAEFNSRLNDCLRKLSSYIQPDEILCYARTSLNDAREGSIEKFIEKFSFVPEIPEACFEYRAPGPGEKTSLLTRPDSEPVATEPQTPRQGSQFRDEPETTDMDGTAPADTPAEKPRGKKRLTVALTVIALLLLAGGILAVRNSRSHADTDDIPVAEQVIPTDTVASGEDGQTEEPADIVAEAIPAAGDNGEAAPVTEGRHYVVAGAFKSQENAVRQIEIMRKSGDGADLSVFFTGKKYIVCPFHSEDREACSRFIVSNHERYPDAWIL